LHEGVPVLGLPFNFDQSLAMAAIERAGAGHTLRCGEASAERLRAEITCLLEDGSAREAAQRMAVALRGMDAGKRFVDLVARITP